MQLLPSWAGRFSIRWVAGLGFMALLWIFGASFFRPPGQGFEPPRHLDHDIHRPHPAFRPHPPPGPATMWAIRADEVRQAYQHAYSGYQRAAADHDELLPVSGGKTNNLNGWRLTIIDSLDTMWIMDLHELFMDATALVAKETFSSLPSSFAPFFETVIRYLGGLLSAYALSREPVLLARADDLGRLLLPAMNTSSGLPMYSVNTQSGNTRAGWAVDVFLSEALSCQMEFKYLAHLTGRPTYYHNVERITDTIARINLTHGLLPTRWDVTLGTPKDDHYSTGAYSDSAYEYFLKQWLLTRDSEPKTRDLYINAATGIIDNLLYLTPTRQLLYVTDIQQGVPSNTFEHLSCFLPGLLALGAHTLDLPPQDTQRHRWAAEGLAYTCWMSYADQATGLGPEEMAMAAGGEKWVDQLEKWQTEGSFGQPPGLREVPKEREADKRDYHLKTSTYLLRPETVESFYYLWRTTGDEVWRDRGWAVFKSIQKETRTEFGYASIKQVNSSPSSKLNEMPSYFMAETLKYLYLLFMDAELIPLDKWVFNTEAHPFPIYDWNAWEKDEYNLV